MNFEKSKFACLTSFITSLFITQHRQHIHSIKHWKPLQTRRQIPATNQRRTTTTW